MKIKLGLGCVLAAFIALNHLNAVAQTVQPSLQEAPTVSVEDALKAALASVAAQAQEAAKPVALDLRQIESIKGTRFNFVKNMSQTFSLSGFKYEPNLRKFTGHLGIYWNTNSSQDGFKGEIKDNGDFIIHSQYIEPGNNHSIFMIGKIVNGKFEATEGSYARLSGDVVYQTP